MGRVLSTVITVMVALAIGGEAVTPQGETCTRMDLGAGMELFWCADSLVSTPEGLMELHVSWTARGLADKTLDKSSDATNSNMYLLDQLGDRYDHVQTTGAAEAGGALNEANPKLEGTFLFPAAQSGALLFTFHDDDQKVSIPGITLSPEPQAPPVVETTGGDVGATVPEVIETATPAPAPPKISASPLLPSGERELVQAAYDGDLDKLRSLMDQGVDPNERSPKTGRTALLTAVFHNQAKAVELLLGSGADVNPRTSSGETALTRAAASNSAETLAALLEGGADVNGRGRDGKTALMLAAEKGNARAVGKLLEAGADVNLQSLRGATALSLAAANQHTVTVQRILRARANPNLKDSFGTTALMLAVDPAACEALIRAGAKLDATDDDGQTPIMRLILGPGLGGDRQGALRTMLDAGADVNARDRRGRTALMLATTGVRGNQSRPELLPILIQAGADLNLQDAQGATALLHAAVLGHLQAAQILIDAGADVNVRMTNRTALAIATDHGHQDMVRLLLRSGARR